MAVKAEEQQTLIGADVPRIDAVPKVNGGAAYTDDLQLAGLLEADLLISPYAYARILSIDVSAARRLPGVAVVLTGDDVAGLYGNTIRDRPILAQGVVRFIGESVAAVAAVSREVARAAIDLIRVEYEQLAPVLNLDAALAEDAPVLHANLGQYFRTSGDNFPLPGTNICSHFKIRKGDIVRGFAAADHVFEDTYEVPRNHHACLETHSVIAQYDGEGGLRLWCANQSPYVLQRTLCELLKLPMNKVQVSAPTLGGGFGSKIYPGIEPLAVMLARQAGRKPVRLSLEREQDFRSSVTNHGARITVKTGVQRDGTLVARHVISHWDTGAYADCGPLVARNSGFTSAGPYRIPHVFVDAYAVYTNTPVASAFRGYGTPHVMWAYESHMDRIAAELGIDPLEFRLKNVIRDGDLSHTGEQMVAVGVGECLRQVAAAVGWQPGRTPAKIDLGDGRYRSLGLACGWKGSMRNFATQATVRMVEDGSVEVNCSNVDMGQGSSTILAQIAAQELGVALDKVTVRRPDTFITPFDRTTSASRGTFHAGRAVLLAARDAWAQLARLAAKVFRSDPEEVTAQAGSVENSRTGQTFSFAQIIGKAVLGGVNVIGQGSSYMEGGTGLDAETGQGANPTSFWMYAANIADVEVDTRTGKVRIHKIFGAADVGHAINRENCRQQIQGGIAMGLGIAMTEEMQFEDGAVANPNLHDYRLPTCPDVPRIVPIIVEVPHPDGPYGAKGLGEMPVGPVAPAIANAIARSTGVRIKSTPMTPERVFMALQKAR